MPKPKRGPQNKQDKRYKTNEKHIRHVVNRALARRQINLRVCDICQGAGISPPTFYLHCRGSDDALKIYEETLVLEFQESLASKPPKREVIFMVLLQFVAHNTGYFSATLVRRDTWLLSQILQLVRVRLIGNQVSDKCFDVYAGSLTSLIFCWGKYERFSKQKIPLYVKKLTQTRVMDLGI